MTSRSRSGPGRMAGARRKSRRALAPLAVVCALGLVGCAAEASDGDRVTLTFGDGYSTSHPVTKYGSLVFLEEIRENGPAVGLDIEFFPNAQLGALEDVPTMLTSGISDLSPVVPAYLSAQIPMSSAFDLPGYTDDACVGASAVTKAISPGTTLRQEEVDALDVVPMWSVYLQGYELMTSEPAEDPRGQRGAILRSPGGAVDRVVAEMGAAGVSMPLGEMYEAVSRGTVDGTVASPISMAPYGLAEVLKHSTIGAELGAVTVFYSMSGSQWAELNEEQRAVVRDAATTTERALCGELNRLLPESQAQMEQEGTTLNHLTPEAKALWQREVSTPAREKWQHDLDSMGLPASAVINEWEAALEEVQSNG